MKWSWKQNIVAMLIFLAIAVSLAIAYPGLPERVPTHFGLQGTPDGYMDRDGYALFILGLTAGFWLLLTCLPWIDPFWKRIQPKYGLLLFIRDLILGFFLFLHLLSLDAARTGVLNMQLFGIGLGLLFVVLGNYLPKIPRNWFIGIRVPWTIASEEVWKRTHRLGGWLFVIGGCVMIALSVMGLSPVVALLVPLVPIMIVVTFIYPYIVFRNLQKTESQP